MSILEPGDGTARRRLISCLATFALVAFLWAIRTPAAETRFGIGSGLISSNAQQIVQLVEAGVQTEVILVFIDSIETPFDLTADAIIYLDDLGIEPSIIGAMLRRDEEIQSLVAPPEASTGVAQTQPFTAQSITNTPVPQTIYVTNPPPQVAYFYSTLEPYGVWIELESLGWCWQPSIVRSDRTWRPYWTGGRWVYTDLGWYWHSDYSWGWNVFHYGRWHRHPRSGWVWFPDLVWGPAWVTWRYSDTYCGWAPLPPGAHFFAGQGLWFNGARVNIDFDFHLAWDHFNFIEIRHMHARNPHRHGVPHDHAKNIHARTRPFNNHSSGPNRRLVNNGVPPERVAAASRQEVPRVAIRDVPVSARNVIRPDHIEYSGSSPVLYRAEVKPQAVNRPMRAQKIIDRAAKAPTVTPRQVPVHGKAPVPLSPPSPRISPERPMPAPITRVPTETARPDSVPPPFRREVGRDPSVAPVAPEPPRTIQPMAPPPSRTAPAPTVRVPSPRNEPSSRFESPRGRDQRLSAGSAPRQVPAHPAQRPALTPSPAPSATPGSPTQGSSRSSQEQKR